MDTQKILNRDFILAFFAQFALSSVFQILIPTLPIYLSRLGSTEVEIGILIGTLSISSLVLRPFVGRALLRIPERNFMIAGAFFFALISIAFLLTSSFWPFLIVRVFQGIGFAFFYTASVTLIANISPEAHRGKSISYFFLTSNIAYVVAPSFGMFLINRFSFTLLFLVCFGISSCSLFITTRLRKRQVNSLVASSIEDGSFFSRKALPPAIVGFFEGIIWGTLITFFPLYALNHGIANPGFFFTVYAIMIILGRVLGGRILDIYSIESVILFSLIFYIISMIILSFSKTLLMFILAAAILGIGNTFLIPSLVAAALDRVGSSRGPAMGTFTAASDFGMGLGPVIMGIILSLSNYQIMFLCLALTGMVSFNYFYFFVKKSRKIIKFIR